MIIVYVTRIRKKDADISYNVAWEGSWAIAEIGFGIIATCTFSLPKFIEAEGSKLRGVFSSLTRPLTSVGFLGTLMRSKNDTTASQEVTVDRITIIEHSESDLPFTNGDQDMERYSSYECVHSPANYPSVNATDTPHRF